MYNTYDWFKFIYQVIKMSQSLKNNVNKNKNKK